MVKASKNKGNSKRNNGNNGPGRKNRSRRIVQRVGGMLDDAAVAWRRLLLDPCNAPLVAPPYAGFGTGSYIRRKAIIQIDTIKDGIFVFQPGTNLYWSAIGQTTGANMIFGSAANVFNIGGSANQLRCLAACVKFRYTGPESTRSGTVGLAVGPPMYFPTQTAVNSLGAITAAPFASRFGETVHEVKWMPSAADEEFHSSEASSYQQRSSCLTVSFANVVGGQWQIEIVAAYETEGSSSEQVPVIATVPPSQNTTNQVLRSLGDYTMWAFTNVAVPVMKATAHAGVAMYSRGMVARTVNQNRIGMM